MSAAKRAKSISEETRTQILEAAWSLIASEGRADVGLAEIAARAGVSRQTVFYAFGGRAGVLTAMVRHRDAQTGHVAALRAALSVPEPTPADVVAAAEAWLDYLPIIYPVGVLLDSAALTDADADAAWRDRMIDALLRGFRGLLRRVHARHPLDAPPDTVADELWADLHPSAWRRLVIECGWTPEAFNESRLHRLRARLRPSTPAP